MSPASPALAAAVRQITAAARSRSARVLDERTLAERVSSSRKVSVPFGVVGLDLRGAPRT